MRRLKRLTMPAFAGAGVGLRPERLGEAMGDGVAGAGAVERVLARGSAVGFSFFVDGEAVGELGAIVGQDGVHRKREAVEKAGEEAGSGFAATIAADFEIDKAGSAVDRDPSLHWGRL